MTPTTRDGFSVIEALVVLMIAGTALLLVFQVGIDGAQTGFRLGRRALATADAEPGIGSLRTVIRGARFGDRPRTLAGPVGNTRGFTTAASLDRAGLCGEAGPAGRLSVRLEATAEGDLLTCAAAGGTATVLIDLRPTRARFSYSDDAAVWRATARPPRTAAPGRRLYVRLTSDDGTLDIVEESAPFPEAEKTTPPPPPAPAL